MRVEQHEADRAVYRRLRAQLAEDDRVVASEHEGDRPGAQDWLERGVDLLGRTQRVAGRDLQVAAVDHARVANTSTSSAGW